jgi:hypothetical protein
MRYVQRVARLGELSGRHYSRELFNWRKVIL